ncbi:hypothetical protein MMPV_002122 [Pyropia vietnamensis]
MSGGKRARSPAGTSLNHAATTTPTTSAADVAEQSLIDAPDGALPAAPPKRPRSDATAAGSGSVSARPPSGGNSSCGGSPAAAAVAARAAAAADSARGTASTTPGDEATANAAPAGAAAPVGCGNGAEGGSPARGTPGGGAPAVAATAPLVAEGAAAAVDADVASAAAPSGGVDIPGGAENPPPPAGEDASEPHPADSAAGADGVDAAPPTADTTPEERVRSTIKALLNRWAAELAALPESDRRTYKVRAEYATCEQTVEHLRPLLRQLRKRTVARNILRALEEIFDHVAAREYVRANDRYLRLAIGNAPWPMGATMVGIHARSAREKIGEGKVAHVMNDEETRKYITAIKRLVTLAQKYHPTVPSKMMSS